MTVKDKKRGRPTGTKSQLTAESIVICAKTLLLTEGKIPSIRKIAGALSVDAMAIYHYFANKNALLTAVTVSLITEIYQPNCSENSGAGDDNWRLELERLCKSYLKLLQSYPGLLEILLTMSEEGPATVFAKRFQQAVAPLELNDQQLKDALDLLADYLHGFALAINCTSNDGKDTESDSGRENLHLDMLDGPLRLYIRGLEAEAKLTL